MSQSRTTLRLPSAQVQAAEGILLWFPQQVPAAGSKPRSSLADGTSSIERPGSGWPAESSRYGQDAVAAAADLMRTDLWKWQDEVFLHPSLDAASMLQANAAALERLINRIYKPVGSIFGLTLEACAIYLNFRYYLAWHDELVKQGKWRSARVDVFSVAHEIAHNVVAAHNAEHEWYFSAIAEKYVVSLVEYIAKAESDAEDRAA
ncbi:uncharacterized protein UTRI_02478 [Ustilago trichophora]|uniref:Uncharacterized protein n=1 Tax=Ustilago trichophora TaxID=86804 RepID=A0A5C3E6P7_9BASI|nr:uncharacterized protein UTRI_02478 [Ustilago trichophora]